MKSCRTTDARRENFNAKNLFHPKLQTGRAVLRRPSRDRRECWQPRRSRTGDTGVSADGPPCGRRSPACHTGRPRRPARHAPRRPPQGRPLGRPSSFTIRFRVHPGSPVFTSVHPCSPVFTRVYPCIPVFTRVTPAFTRVHPYPCASVTNPRGSVYQAVTSSFFSSFFGSSIGSVRPIGFFTSIGSAISRMPSLNVALASSAFTPSGSAS